MKKTLQVISVVLVLLVFSSCSNKYKYFGNTYPPTQNAKIYFREADIDKPYEVIGKIYSDFKIGVKDEKVQEKIMRQVEKHGGDGAIFGDLHKRKTGSVTSSVGGSTGTGKKRRGRVGGSVSSKKNKEKEQIEVQVIKFK